MKNQVFVPSIFTTIVQAKEGIKLKDNFCAFMWQYSWSSQEETGVHESGTSI